MTALSARDNKGKDKGKMLQSGKGGKLDFDRHFAFLTIILKRF